jgi:tripartite-type tricarboxylate transporter receptor subunit TctC
MTRNIFARSGVIAALSLLVAPLALQPAFAADWAPDGPITIQIGFGAGGSTDTLGRVVAKSMEEATGWDVVVENKPGGGGVAMFSALAQAEPDGQVIGMGVTIPIIMNLILRGDQLPFKADSFDYLATVAVAQQTLVAKGDAPYDDVDGLVAYAKANDGAIIAFDAKPQEMIARAIEKQSGAKVKLLPVKSGAEAVQNLLGGHADAGFVAGPHIEYVKSGELKVLAPATAVRHGYAPDKPTLIEQGYKYSVEPYFYFAAPKGLPADAKATLAKALDDAINSDAAKEIIVNTMRTEPSNLGPDGTAEKLMSGVESTKMLIEASK